MKVIEDNNRYKDGSDGRDKQRWLWNADKVFIEVTINR